MDINQIAEQAKKEIAQEAYRQLVDQYKVKLRSKKWWHKLFPFKIVFIRRD